MKKVNAFFTVSNKGALSALITRTKCSTFDKDIEELIELYPYKGIELLCFESEEIAKLVYFNLPRAPREE